VLTMMQWRLHVIACDRLQEGLYFGAELGDDSEEVCQKVRTGMKPPSWAGCPC